MALVKFTYKPAITGSIMDSYIKSSCSALDAQRTNVGLKVWEYALQKLYEDFNTTLKTAIMTYLSQAEIIFIPAGPSPITWGQLNLSAFKSKVKITAANIDTQGKAACAGKPAQLCGPIMWETAYKNIFLDICPIVANAVALSGNTATTIVPAGAIAPPHVGTTAPAPATLTVQFVPAMLQGLLTSTLSPITAKSLGTATDSQGKSSCAGKPAPACGAIMWDVFLLKLSTQLNTDLQKHIKTYLQSVPRFTVTAGTPGTNPAPPPPVLPTAGVVFGNIN